MSWFRAVGRLGLCSCLLLVACSRDPQVLKQKYYESGRRYFEQKKYGEAVIEFSRALHQDHLFGAARFQLAESYMAQGNTKLAFPQYVKAADLLPNDPIAQVKAGNLLVKGGFFDEAKDRARKVLQKDPKNVAALMLLGNALANLKSLDDAVGVIENAITIDPERAGAFANLGVFELAQGDRTSAATAFEKAVEIDPKSVEALLNLGQFYRTDGKRAEAETMFKRAHAIDARNERVNRALGSLYVEWNRPTEAEPYFKAVVESSKLPGPKYSLADFYIGVGQFDRAEKMLKELAAEPKQFAPAQSRLAALAFAQGNTARAEALIDEVLKGSPDDAGAQIVNARLLLAHHRVDEAALAIKVALAKSPDSSEAHVTLGRIETARHKVEEARKAFVEALRLSPRSLPALLELSVLHRTNNEVASAVRLAEQAVRNYPTNIAARLTLIRALSIRPSDRTRAESHLAAVRKAYPNLPRLQALIGENALARNDLPSAERAFARQLGLDSRSKDALAGLIAIDVSRGRMGDARARVEGLLKKNPNDAGALLLSAKLYRTVGDIANTEKELVRAIELDGSNPEAFAMLGHIYLSQGKSNIAKAKYEAVAKLRPRQAGPATMLGLLNYAEGNREEAWRWWQKAVDIDPAAAAAANNLAWLSTEMGKNLDGALQLALRALAKMPEQPQFAHTVGWIHYLKQSSREAVYYLKQSADKDQKNPVYQYHLGMAYAQMGEDASARRYLKQALSLNKDFPGSEQARKVMASLVY